MADIASDAASAVIGEQIKGRTVAMVVHAPGVPVAGGVLEVSTDALNACCNIKAAGFLRLVRAADSAPRRGPPLVAIGGHYGFAPSASARQPAASGKSLPAPVDLGGPRLPHTHN